MSQEKIYNSRNILAKNVEKFRKEKGLKREELSLTLGFDNSYISKIEKSRINITIDKIEVIAKFFNKKIVDLFAE